MWEWKNGENRYREEKRKKIYHWWSYVLIWGICFQRGFFSLDQPLFLLVWNQKGQQFFRDSWFRWDKEIEGSKSVWKIYSMYAYIYIYKKYMFMRLSNRKKCVCLSDVWRFHTWHWINVLSSDVSGTAGVLQCIQDDAECAIEWGHSEKNSHNFTTWAQKFGFLGKENEA